MPPTCPICQQSAQLTDEDIVPTWARNHIVRSYGPFPPGQAPPRVKIRICRACNGALGQMYENDAATTLVPMIDGETVRLTPAAQSRVAAWITKSSLLGHLAGARPGDWGHHEAGRRLRVMLRTGEPPVQTLVRVGRRDVNDDDEDARAVLTGLLPAQQRMPQLALWSVSSLGNLLWECSMGAIDEVLQFVRWCDRQKQDALWRVWPPTESEIVWPPPTTVTTAQIKALRQRHYNARVPGMVLNDPWRRNWLGPDT